MAWRLMAVPSQAHPTLGGEGWLEERPEQRRGRESPKNGEDKREESFQLSFSRTEVAALR